MHTASTRIERGYRKLQSNDVGKVYVQHFDVMLGNHFDIHTLCVHSPECGRAIAVEHNGDVYSCDHFVEEDPAITTMAQLLDQGRAPAEIMDL